MPLYDTDVLQRYYFQAENDISVDRPFLSERLSLDIDPSTSVYTLPDYVVSIRRITWYGMKLDPLPHRNFREVFQSATQKGRPFWYVYNNVGQNQVQFFPAPSVSISAVTGSLYLGLNLLAGVVVEYYRVTDNASNIVPLYARRQLLKNYAASRVFANDGAGQNLKLAKYFSDKWFKWKQDFMTHLDDLYGRPRKLIINEIVSSNYFPAAPVLPIAQFGISVDEGY